MLVLVVVLFSAFSPSIIAGQSPLRGTNDVTLPSAIKFAAEAHSPSRGVTILLQMLRKCASNAGQGPGKANAELCSIKLIFGLLSCCVAFQRPRGSP